MTQSQIPQSLEGFRWAVIRLATHVAGPTSPPRLLFGTVSLLTNDRSRPQSDVGVAQHWVGKGKREQVFFRSTVLSAVEAIGWYRSPASAGLVTPIPSDPAEVDSALDGKPLASALFADDPGWPTLGIPSGSDILSSGGGPGDPAPFTGVGHARIHRRFGDDTGFDAMLADSRAISFLKRRLHIDLADYTEYLGSLALVVPNPLLRDVQHFLVPNEDGKGEQLAYRLLPRPGQSLADFSLTLIERQANLLSRFDTVAVPSDGLVTQPNLLPVQASGYAVSHPVHGILSYQAPVPFIRTVNVSLGIAGRRVKVVAPRSDSPRSATDEYEVTEFGHEVPINVGDAEPTPALTRIIEAEVRRDRRAVAKRYKQTWFEGGDRTAALTFLRGVIAGARSDVMVADPYFGASQILQFLHAVPRTAVDFKILTSRLAFESENLNSGSLHPEDDILDDQTAGNPTLSPRHEAELARLDKFAASMATFANRGMRSATALVLAGKVPPLHDRFLVIDGTVWFLGNSLNALGDRASLILQVPDSEPILARLNAMVLKSTPFATYADRRRKVLISPRED